MSKKLLYQLQSAWEEKLFRDCNGESNGLEVTFSLLGKQFVSNLLTFFGSAMLFLYLIEIFQAVVNFEPIKTFSSPKKPKLRSWKRRTEDIDIDMLPNYPTVDHDFDNCIIMDYIDINLLPIHLRMDRIDTCKLQ